MQDRYTGDVGDFGKYGLLRALCGDDLSLGVVWYLVPDEEGSGDGGHVGYLDPTPRNLREFRECDPPLYDTLGEIVRDGVRSVRSVRERGVLSEGTTFYEAPLTFERGTGQTGMVRRLERRHAWAWRALEATRGRDMVFADPDNGQQPASADKFHRRGNKYAYYGELLPYLDRGQSLAVYHHHGRNAPVEIQLRERLGEVRERLGGGFAMRYLRGPARTFFVVPSAEHGGTLYERARHMAQETAWSQHFTLYRPEDFD